ncbi:MAG TPA: hypothetical protein VGK50_04055 [Coriobacteriia bacterium]|jgi:hypothetical protein
MPSPELLESIADYVRKSSADGVPRFSVDVVSQLEGWAVAEVAAEGLETVQVVMVRDAGGGWHGVTLGTSIDPNDFDFPAEVRGALW